MEFQEYPKALYKGDQAHIVADAIEEAQARKDGFAEWQPEAAEPAHDAPAVRGRKHKPSAEAEAE